MEDIVHYPELYKRFVEILRNEGYFSNQTYEKNETLLGLLNSTNKQEEEINILKQENTKLQEQVERFKICPTCRHEEDDIDSPCRICLNKDKWEFNWQPIKEQGSMEKYRKKPVVIEAVLWTGKNLKEVLDFTGRHHSVKDMQWNDLNNMVITEGLKIFTLEGKMSANIGDYIIKGVKGEFYPCKPDIFHQTYELIKE